MLICRNAKGHMVTWASEGEGRGGLYLSQGFPTFLWPCKFSDHAFLWPTFLWPCMGQATPGFWHFYQKKAVFFVLSEKKQISPYLSVPGKILLKSARGPHLEKILPTPMHGQRKVGNPWLR